jgi:hypothetical protein
VTIIHAADLLRVACNRDESRQRPQAHPPFITVAGGHQVLTPQDPRGRGTWIAANSAGLVFALLNAAPSQPAPSAEGPSRGLIIPALLDCSSIDDVAWRLSGMPQDAVSPCRLLVADREHIIEAQLGSGLFHIRVHPTDRPLLFTSSSLGDGLVEGPRRALFEQMLPSRSRRSGPSPVAQDLADRQDAFHAHRWRDRPAVSVHMSRPDACTVSTTIVEVTAREVRMTYEPAHCAAGTPIGLIIDRQQVEDDAPRRTRREYAAV